MLQPSFASPRPRLMSLVLVAMLSATGCATVATTPSMPTLDGEHVVAVYDARPTTSHDLFGVSTRIGVAR